MPVHDWTRVKPGTYHDFHSSWIIHLKETLNTGLLPEGYYALAEQHAGQVIADVLTLQAPEPSGTDFLQSSVLAVAERPPQVTCRLVASPNARATQRTLAIRHASGHRLVALVEITSPANKDRPSSVKDFVDKAHAALQHGCHLLIIDLLPPGLHDPQGLPAAIWEAFDPEGIQPPADKPLTLAAFVAKALPDAFVEHLAVGDECKDMPLFLDVDHYVNLPLEATYQAAYRGMPAFWRRVLEAPDTAPGG